MNPDHYPSVTVVAGEVRHIAGHTSPMLRMHDGQIYIHISPAIAQQWIPVLEEIAKEIE